MTDTRRDVRDVAKELNSVLEEKRRELLSSAPAPSASSPSNPGTTELPNSSEKIVIGSVKSALISRTLISTPPPAPTTTQTKIPSSERTDEPWIQIRFHLDGRQPEVTGGNFTKLSMGALQRMTERLPRFAIENARKESLDARRRK